MVILFSTMGFELSSQLPLKRRDVINGQPLNNKQYDRREEGEIIHLNMCDKWNEKQDQGRNSQNF